MRIDRRSMAAQPNVMASSKSSIRPCSSNRLGRYSAREWKDNDQSGRPGDRSSNTAHASMEASSNQ
ncbi:hypothetical protein SCLCIDRAFT_935151 [Scleroderma citrinum Foug A]|uniref:Uncharacterized protein n=1 Tax=Scleroderma citrinum Foug A TaxID=1036808 RepID=A0A0C3A7C3_9AGAM|nr:hypothetical protein SCLCIDRAFT_935151 [Scleroderma citrinum Foug A]